MKKEIILNNKKFTYTLEYKNVKNINLRIKPDGIYVSANYFVNEKMINDYVLSKEDFILKALDKYKNAVHTVPEKIFSESELCDFILNFCEKIYPYYEKYCKNYPQIKFKSMVSRWGSCHPQKCILTFNKNLIYAPQECVKYVVWHEFTHFIQANHSAKFYMELEKVCPTWKACRLKLREINIR